MASTASNSLQHRLAAVLPESHTFTVHHISTPPSKCSALYSAPPNERADKTYCESHFLTVSIDASPALSSSSTTSKTSTSSDKVIVLGLEVFIYTTAFSTTIFVSKADSTGYLNLLDLPKGTPSPIREVCTAFIDYLIESRKRKDVQLVVSLFARAQSQYLFPGSVENTGKHVLDDRGLIKWWCRVLTPLVEAPPSPTSPAGVKGYLIVPGLDAHETKAFVPRTPGASSWSMTHPLREISHYTKEFDWVPARCLIPRFPDDPKSRFRDELDDESARSGEMKMTGNWKSVRTLETFWEMMAFRQECSSGRMTGFVWLVSDVKPEPQKESATIGSLTPSASFREETPAALPETPKKQRIAITQVTPSTTPRKLFPSKSDQANSQNAAAQEKSKRKQKTRDKKKRRTGLVRTRQPRVKTSYSASFSKIPVSTPYYNWPAVGRGERVLSEADLKHITEQVQHLDFSTLEKALASTRRFVKEAGQGRPWGWDVVGTRALPAVAAGGAHGQDEVRTNDLSGRVKRKRNNEEPNGAPAVNVLNAGLVRKKPKV
ncbi:histone acetylation protein [Sarocladium implicatum]|nr:histone acetylation protein [Sarocladium implicatum]